MRIVAGCVQAGKLSTHRSRLDIVDLDPVDLLVLYFVITSDRNDSYVVSHTMSAGEIAGRALFSGNVFEKNEQASLNESGLFQKGS